MSTLAERIGALIHAQGPLSIAQFMTVALHDPADGYYATKEVFGSSGDFVTAPEVSQMFGELVALWMAQVWHDQGRPEGRLVELGPGRGTLMRDCVRTWKAAIPEFLHAMKLVLVEVSPRLREVQRETLNGVTIEWQDRFDDRLGDAPLFLIANEFFDALPIRQYVKTARGWCERMVSIDEAGALCFALAPVPVSPGTIPPDRSAAPVGGVYEISPAGNALAEEIGHIIARHKGAALIVDYGYEKVGFGETLQAVKGHGFAEVLVNPGASDLSAHVDFKALAHAIAIGGADVSGPAGQGEFLKRLGIARRAAKLAASNPQEKEAVDAALSRLTAKDQMGVLFKVLAVLPKATLPPPGFA